METPSDGPSPFQLVVILRLISHVIFDVQISICYRNRFECVSVVHGTDDKKCMHTQDSHGYEQIWGKYIFWGGYLRVSEKKTLFLELPKLMKYMNIFK